MHAKCTEKYEEKGIHKSNSLRIEYWEKYTPTSPYTSPAPFFLALVWHRTMLFLHFMVLVFVFFSLRILHTFAFSASNDSLMTFINQFNQDIHSLTTKCWDEGTYHKHTYIYINRVSFYFFVFAAFSSFRCALGNRKDLTEENIPTRCVRVVFVYGWLMMMMDTNGGSWQNMMSMCV